MVEPNQLWVASIKKLTWIGIRSRLNQLVYALPWLELDALGTVRQVVCQRQKLVTIWITRMRSVEFRSGQNKWAHGATLESGTVADRKMSLLDVTE